MASLRVLAFDHEGRPVQFDTWLGNLQLYLLSDSKGSVSLFDLASGAATAPPTTTDNSTRSQTAQALYNAVVACYSSPATAALGRLLLPYLFSELFAFTTVEDLVSHLRASDPRYRATVPVEFLDRNPPPMDHFLSLDPTSLTVDLLEQHLLAAETSAVAVGAARGTPRPPFFEGCSPSTLAPSYASAAAAYVSVSEDVEAASASAKRRSSKGKGGRGGGGGSGSGGGGTSGGGGGCGTIGGNGGSGGGGGGSGGSGGSGGGGTSARRAGSGGCQRQQHQRRSETPSPQQLREWFLRGASGGSCPYVIRKGDRADLLKARIAIFDLDFDAILSAMYALSVSAEGDCYRCVPPDPGIAAAALGANESGTLPGTAPAKALHTFTLDSGASRFVARSSTLLPCPAVPSGSLSGLHLPSFSTNLVSTAVLQDAMVTTTTPGGSSLYTLATEPSQIAASAQVSASGQVAASCSCRLLSHQTLLWHHRLGHPSLPPLRGMHSRLLVSGLPRSLPPLPPSSAPPCLPCVERWQHAAPHSSSFPPTTAPLQILHMDVKGQVVDVLIPWILTVYLQLRERFGQDLPVLRLHSDRGGEFSSNLLRDFCRGEGILQSFTLPDSPQQNGIAERRIGLVMEPRVSLPENSPTLRWTGEVGDASVFRVWGSLLPPTSHSVFPLQDVTFDESVPVYRLFPYRSAPPPPPPLFLAPGPPPVDPLLPQGPAPSGLGVEIGGAEPGGVATGGGEPEGAEPKGVEPRGAALEGAESGGAEPQGAALSGGSAGASPSLSPQQLREWFVRRTRLRHGASGAGGTGVAAGAGVTGGTATTGPGGACPRGTGAARTCGVVGAGDLMESGATGAGGDGAGGAGVGGPGAGGAGVGGPGVGGAGAGGAGAVALARV
ncbi:unnamed protein product [Closterium sp. NIES-53]